MRLNETAKTAWDFKWDPDRYGFYVTKHGEEVPDTFTAAKDAFDRSEAQEATKKRMFQLRALETSKVAAERDRAYQFDKPLTELELEWVELDKHLVRSVKDHTPMPGGYLERYNRIGQIVRRSLLDHTHPAMAHRKQ